MKNDDFKFTIPAEITKSKDGEWRVAGVASTASVDRQGEVIIPDGIDATPIAKGKGFFNWDHDNSPENTVGVLDSYKKGPGGMYVEGRLFKNHSRAKAVYEIMSSLNKGDTGRVGMSVEGKVIERDPKNPNIIRRCLIKNVALTMNPVNQDTFADIVKSMSGDGLVEFDSTGVKEQTLTQDGLSQTPVQPQAPMFTAEQVIEIVQKALSISSGNAAAPADRSGGDALGMESMDKEPKKKLKKMNKSLYKSNVEVILDRLQKLYPENSREQIWSAVKTRLEATFPEVQSFEEN